MTKELDVAKQAAQAGADVVCRYFRDGVAMRSKESYNLVSDADVESEQAIVKTIRTAFPTHEVMGEEEHHGRADAEHLWVVDPLDGTNNFAHDVPHFAISIAYYRNGAPQVGVVVNPVRDDWYETVRGQGATHNGKPAAASGAARLDEVLVGVGFYYDRGAMMESTLDAIRELFGQNIHGIRRFGTAALDLCQVGCGWFGAFFEYELSPWDFAAGRLFVEEAGGVVTTCGGEPLGLQKTSLLAAGAALHPTVLEIVQRHAPAQSNT